jgi:hypothetical protein
VVVPNDRDNWIREANGREDVRSNPGVEFHPFELAHCELSWLVENVLWHHELS